MTPKRPWRCSNRPDGRNSPARDVLQKDGKPFEFEFLLPAGSKLGEQIATMLQENLKEIGIAMSIQRLEWAVFIQRIEEHNFDACTLSWGLGWETDPYQIWHSSQAVDKGSNFVGFKDAEADTEGRADVDQRPAAIRWRKCATAVSEP